MSEGAAKGRKRANIADEAVEQFVGKRRTRTQEKEQTQESTITQKFANIESNPFHQIVVQSDASPTEKKNAVAKALAYDETKSQEENEAQIAAFEEFKEYLMAYRKEVSKEIIRLSDTEAFSELQAVFEEMNSSLMDFEKQITPLVEIIDAVHRLNMASGGAMYDVFKEIQEDKEEEARLAAEREKLEADINGYTTDLSNLHQDIAALREDKSWFGFGGTSKKALQEIARKEVRIAEIQSDLADARHDVEGLKSQRETKFAEFASEKAQLRELLDITSEEHKERQEALVKAALNFVNTTEERTGSVLEHMNGMRNQIKDIDTVNGNMKRIFTVVTEGIKDAEGQNETLTNKFRTAVENETELEKLDREEKGQAIEQHVETLNTSKLDTLGTLGELQQESMNIKSMRDTNNQQIAHTRKMHSSGTAGVASRLSTVLTAVSSAALNEARTTTQNTLDGMNTITHEIAQSEAIKNATQLHVQNDQLSKAIDELATYRDVADKATEITRSALEEQKILQREMEETAADLAKSVKDAKGITAEVMQDGENAVGKKAANQNGDRNKPSAGGLGQFKL